MIKKLLFVFSFFIFGKTSLTAQDLISAQWKGSQNATTLNQQFGLAIFTYNVNHYKIQYTSLDINGQLDTLSGLLTIPFDETKIFPMLCYQHGTVDNKNDVPSNLEGGFQLAEIWGALGYLTFAPDYLGLGDGRGFHPYVHRASEAWAAIDMFAAVKTYLDGEDILYNDQFFVTGYSQGGHGAASLHRELEENFSEHQITVTASAPMSGPYSISGVMNDFMLEEIPYNFVAYLPNTIMSYQTAYGNLYDELEDVFRPGYVDDIEMFYNGEIGLFDLNQLLINSLVQEFGESIPIKIFQDSVVTAITDNPNHPMNIALRDNDVHDWAPQAPTRLYYCKGDDQVPYMNSVVADSVMNMMGAIDTDAVSLGDDLDHGGCVQPAMLNAIIFFGGYAQVDDINSVFDPSVKNQFSIYPNPMEDVFFLESENESGVLQIFDLTGRVMLEKNISLGKNEVSVAQLGKGLYLAKVNFGERFYTRKILIK